MILDWTSWIHIIVVYNSAHLFGLFNIFSLWQAAKYMTHHSTSGVVATYPLVAVVRGSHLFVDTLKKTKQKTSSFCLPTVILSSPSPTLKRQGKLGNRSCPSYLGPLHHTQKGLSVLRGQWRMGVLCLQSSKNISHNLCKVSSKTREDTEPQGSLPHHRQMWNTTTSLLK